MSMYGCARLIKFEIPYFQLDYGDRSLRLWGHKDTCYFHIFFMDLIGINILARMLISAQSVV